MIKTWNQFCEAKSFQPPDYSRAARISPSPGGFGGTIAISQARLTLVGSTLQIDSRTHSVAMNLTPQQQKQLLSEFGSGTEGQFAQPELK
jgi:hypothetical protein